MSQSLAAVPQVAGYAVAGVFDEGYGSFTE